MMFLIALALSDIWGRIEPMSWPLRLIWVAMVVGAGMNLAGSLLPQVEPRWRNMYRWKAGVCALSAGYFLISALGLIGPGLLISLLRWLFPIFAFSMSLSALMHMFEWKAIKDELSHRRGEV